MERRRRRPVADGLFRWTGEHTTPLAWERTRVLLIRRSVTFDRPPLNARFPKSRQNARDSGSLTACCVFLVFSEERVFALPVVALLLLLLLLQPSSGAVGRFVETASSSVVSLNVSVCTCLVSRVPSAGSETCTRRLPLSD